MIDELLNYEAKSVAGLIGLSEESKINISIKIESGVDFILENISDFTYIGGEEHGNNHGATGLHIGKICKHLMSLASDEKEKVIVMATLRTCLLEIMEDSVDPMTAFIKSLTDD